MPLQNLKKQVSDLLRNDRLKQALTLILANLKEDAFSRDTFLLQEGRLASLNRDVNKGIIDYDVKSRTINQIRAAIKGSLDDIMQDDLLDEQLPAQHNLKQSELDMLEQQGLRKQVELLLKKINRTREALAIEDDPGRQIRYETQLEQWDAELKGLKQRAGL